jgi:peptide/nickel transport system permease protein
MLVFTMRRVLLALPILLGVSLIVFSIVHMVPGNAIDLLLPPEAPPAVIAKMKADFGFDKPLPIQYLRWLWRTVQGDLGLSIFTGEPVSDELLEALGNTFQMAIPAAVIGCALGYVFGLIAAFRAGGWFDRLLSGVAIIGVSLPHYWLAIVLVMIFSVFLNWLPAQGMGDAGLPVTQDQIQHLILPVATLALIPMGLVARFLRATVIELLGLDFVATLSAKGLTRSRILWHVIKNAAPATLAMVGLQFGYMLGGSILIETVFNWPGTGNVLNLAIFRRDLPVLQATVLVLASFFVVLNLLVDIAQAMIDPRIRR